MELQIQEYGQTPKQLFKVPHPPRNSIQSLDPPVKYVHKYWKAEAITRKPKSEVHETQVHSRRVTSVYKFEGKTISTSIDGDIGISGKKITVQRPIHTSALSHSGILYLSTNDSIIIANLTTSKVISEFKAHEARISALQCASSDVLVTGSWDNTLKLWDMRTRPKSVFKTTAFNEVTCVVCDVFNPNLATCGDMQGRLTQIDFRKGVVQWEDISECIFALQDLGQEGILACGSEKTEVIKENDREKYLDFGGVQTAVSDSIVIYIGKEGQELQLWQFQGNLCLFKWDEICNVTCVTSENGEVLAGNIEGKLFQIN